MSSVLLSSQSFLAGDDIAAGVARATGSDLGRLDHLIASAAASWQVAPDKLGAALLRPPSLLGMADATRRRLVRLVMAECSRRIAGGDTVIHVPFAAFMVPGISHVLRVRVTASADERARAAATQLHLPDAKARKRIDADDRAIDMIGSVLFQRRDTDADYDLVVRVAERKPEVIASEIVQAAGERSYQPTSYSIKAAQELAAAHCLEAALAAREIDASAAVKDGLATVKARAAVSKRSEATKVIDTAASRLPAIEKVEVAWVDDLFETYAASMR
jgi:hypothetical protein